MKLLTFIRSYHDRNPEGLCFHPPFNPIVEPLPLYAGSEIEVSSSWCNGALLQELAFTLHEELGFGVCHCEMDKSVNNGLEVITQPMTLNFILNGGFQWIQKICEICKFYGFTGRDASCGLHFHVSKNGFNALTEGNLWKLFYRFNMEFRNLSGRSSFNKLERFAKFPRGENQWEQHDRYYAINLFPLDTVEFRFPAGLDVNKPEIWLGFAEIFIGIVEWARNKLDEFDFRIDFKEFASEIPHFELRDAKALLMERL